MNRGDIERAFEKIHAKLMIYEEPELASFIEVSWSLMETRKVIINQQEQSIQTLTDKIDRQEISRLAQFDLLNRITEENKILEQQYKDDERTIKKLVAENKSLRCCGNCKQHKNRTVFQKDIRELKNCMNCKDLNNWQPKDK